MKKTNKLIGILLAVLISLFVICACGNKAAETKTETKTEAKTETTTATTATTAPVVEEVELTAADMVFPNAPDWMSDCWETASAGENGAVACSSKLASEIGVQILEKGGNAVDAAVAMIYAVGLLEPAASGMGGAGEMLIYLADEDRYTNLEYLTMVPAAAEIGVTDTDGNSNPPSVQSIAIPGVVHGTMTALEKYGTLSRREVLQPVIDIARNGFPTPKRWNSNLDGRYANISAYPYTLSLYTDDGFFYEDNQLVTNPDLADTLEVIADQGIKGFYDSEFTDKMVDYIQEMGGILTHEDFANYTTVEREPISTTYRGYNVISVSGPVKGGAALLEALNITEHFDLASYGFDSATAVQIKAESFLLGCKDGYTFMTDPGFYNVPVDTIISKEYAAERAQNITPGKRMKSAPAGKLEVTLNATGEAALRGDVKDPGGTTHLVVMDKYGNVVSTTNTNGQNFGSALAVPGTGFVFSAHLMLFDAQGNKKLDALIPGARTSSSICPSMVADADGKPVLAIGSPGNWCTCSAAYEGIVNYIDFGMTAMQAINAPRTYRDYMTSKDINVEGFFSESTIQGLMDMGYNIIPYDSATGYSSHVGSLAAVELRDGLYQSAGDYRRYYGSAAY